MNFKKIGSLIIVVFLTGCAGETPILGVTAGKLIPCPDKPNCVNSQIVDNEHFIKPIIISKTHIEPKEQLTHIINGIKSAEIKEVKNDYLRVEFVSAVFGFVDDVEFYFPASTSNKVVVDVRSASRVGHSDFGVNRKRIEEIRNKL